jgi:metallo-beta-lactamase family protein
LHQLKSQNKIPDIPMYLNSPMATNVTQLLKQFRSLHKLSIEKCDEICSTVKYVKSVEESKWLNEQKGPMVIISASGMATGGRILHHLKAFAGDPKNFIVLAGFQAAGTRGRSLQDGSQEIKIFRELIPVRAKVEVLENLSAHADGAEEYICDPRRIPSQSVFGAETAHRAWVQLYGANPRSRIRSGLINC